jgi:hypothetical protein
MKMTSAQWRRFLRWLPVAAGLTLAALTLKSCDGGGENTSGRKSTSGTTDKTTGDDADDEEDSGGPVPDAGSEGSSDGKTSVYTLTVSLENYADTDAEAFRFYLDAKDGSKQTFLKEVTTSGLDFSAAKFTFASDALTTIDDFVDTETCVTVKAVRSGLESEESDPYCFTEW